MQYVVCYDISDDARRSRVASALLDFGSRVEESVFVANLDSELAAKMLDRIRRLVEERSDRVHVFEMCASCAARTVAIGEAEIVKDQRYYII